MQAKRSNGSSSYLYLPKIGLLYKFNSIPAWRNNRSSRAGQLLNLPTNPTLCDDSHTLWHTENIIKLSFINFLKVHLHLNHFLMLEQFSPEARGTSSALGYDTGVIPQARRTLWVLQLCFGSTQRCQINPRPTGTELSVNMLPASVSICYLMEHKRTRMESFFRCCW